MRNLKIENIKEGMEFWESCPYGSAKFIATEDGYMTVDENNNEYWVVHGREVETEEIVEFSHLEGFYDYPSLYDYQAYVYPDKIEDEYDFGEDHPGC